ncbi:5' nucleotidase, NT5C type [Niallia circulans]|uniref:Nucleotidase n=1 Tax=Niallia circulans TaxID=1397 RepID=A0A941JJP4_NIACI|nr:HAD hydrolase-like protein [Niallia circulans]MCB5238561.1 HAD hydrolase-like protein [Niallia circulans]
MNHIGLDFDDTLVDMRKSIVQLLNKIHNQDLNYEEMVEYAVSDLYGYSFEAFLDFFTKNQKVLHLAKPCPFIIDVLSELSKTSRLSIMTGRPKAWMNSAELWIVKNKLPIDDIICASEYKNGKPECALIHNVTLFIEDNPSHALAVTNSGMDVWLLDKPYNRICNHERITRVKDWKEIGTLLLR